VVHSPLVRAAESAAILAAACRLDAGLLRADLRLREISFGDCEGLTADEIAAAHPEFWQRHQQGLADAFPGGESRRAFAERVAAAIVDHVESATAEDLLVVAHRGIVRCGVEALLGAGVVEPRALGVRLGSLTVVRRDAGWRLELLDFVP
jgi:broad specificity phosphatase PhoE